jgi:phosphatidylethanolamine/phosphatidyl-N-methylethanolamine N-methyltransferase
MSFIIDHLRFFRALASRPRHVGAVMPSGPQLARAMAAQIRLDGPVLELGPGTGCITEAILQRVPPRRITAIEYDSEFAGALKARFPDITVIEGDAFDLDHTLNRAHEPFAAVVSGLPLLNFSMEDRHRLVEGALARLAPGGCLIQFSYGLHAPVVPPDGYMVFRAAFAWANIPPARVWVYRKV